MKSGQVESCLPEIATHHGAISSRSDLPEDATHQMNEALVPSSSSSRARHSEKPGFIQQLSTLYKMGDSSNENFVEVHEGLGDSSNSSQDTQLTMDNHLLLDSSSIYSSSSQPLTTSDHHPSESGVAAAISLVDNNSSDSQALKQGVGFDAALNRYVCQWCGRNFDRISNLKRHVLLHSGIKPFKCLYCSYRATQKANVVQHLASRHREEMRALLHNNINVNDILVPSGPVKR